jgi:hypothetical protein
MLSLFAIARFMVIRNATAFDSEVKFSKFGTGRDDPQKKTKPGKETSPIPGTRY